MKRIFISMLIFACMVVLISTSLVNASVGIHGGGHGVGHGSHSSHSSHTAHRTIIHSSGGIVRAHKAAHFEEEFDEDYVPCVYKPKFCPPNCSFRVPAILFVISGLGITMLFISMNTPSEPPVLPIE